MYYSRAQDSRSTLLVRNTDAHGVKREGESTQMLRGRKRAHKVTAHFVIIVVFVFVFIILQFVVKEVRAPDMLFL